MVDDSSSGMPLNQSSRRSTSGFEEASNSVAQCSASFRTGLASHDSGTRCLIGLPPAAER